MSQPANPAQHLGHRVRAMVGRDPNEKGRVSTNLELLFDLTFAIAFGQAGGAAAHLIATGHVPQALVGFVFSTFAICWAWINFSWFASAFDTDDWLFRVTTMVQMIGVLIMALGMPAMFSSFEHGWVPNNRVMVAGYVVMRVAMIVNWIRVARSDSPYRGIAKRYIVALVIAQVGWVVVAIAPLHAWQWLLAGVVLYAVELLGPIMAESNGLATPWHPEHIAERYSLLTIVTLGECLIGTITALAAQVQEGWNWQVGAAILGGVLLTFGLWWLYYFVPGAPALEAKGMRYAFPWGYSHMLVFGSLAAVGAGLHVVAYVLEGEATISHTGAVASVAVPVAIYFVMLVLLYGGGVGFDLRYVALVAAMIVIVALAVVLAAVGVPMAVCLLVIAAGPMVGVITDEVGMRQRREQQLAELEPA